MALESSLRQYQNGTVLCDLVAVALAYAIAVLGVHVLRYDGISGIPLGYVHAFPYALAIQVCMLRATSRIVERELAAVAVGSMLGLAVLLSVSFFYRDFSYSRLAAIGFGGLTLVLVPMVRVLYRHALRQLFRGSRWEKRVVILGDGPASELLGGLFGPTRRLYKRLAQFSWFEDNWIAVADCRCNLPGRNRDRKIPWRYQANHSDRLPGHLNINARPDRCQLVAGKTQGFPGKETENLRRPYRFSHTLGERLALFTRQQPANLVPPGRNFIACGLQDVMTLLNAAMRPLARRIMCRCYRRRGIACRCAGIMRDNVARVGWVHIGNNILAVRPLARNQVRFQDIHELTSICCSECKLEQAMIIRCTGLARVGRIGVINLGQRCCDFDIALGHTELAQCHR